MINRSLAELFGTFTLVFAGCGAIVANETYNGALGHLGVALAFGLVVLAMIYAVGNISGAHLNPAVTIGFLLAGRFEKRRVVPYILCQCVGAVLAAGLLRFLYPENENLGATLPNASMLRVFVMETVLSFILMFVILNVSTGAMEKGIMAGVAVGGTVALEALFGGPMTGASMNPARSIGPALVSGNVTALWIYVAAPVLGMALASPACRWIQGSECCAENRQEADACDDKATRS